jgi:hypothetical protein
MANHGELPNHPVQANVQAGHQQSHLDAARPLMLLGAAAAVSTVYNCNPDADASQVFIAIIGFLAWLLGVCLLSLVPLLAGRFPQADRFAGATIVSAGAVLRRLFIPWN